MSLKVFNRILFACAVIVFGGSIVLATVWNGSKSIKHEYKENVVFNVYEEPFTAQQADLYEKSLFAGIVVVPLVLMLAGVVISSIDNKKENERVPETSENYIRIYRGTEKTKTDNTL
ncbi:MAG: hypothetical protein N2171_02375 [Clostridia bacterium]|nr:hypothetical protein [Clostridia bacterium]